MSWAATARVGREGAGAAAALAPPTGCRARRSAAAPPSATPASTLYAALARSNDALPIVVVAAAAAGLLAPSSVAFFTPAWFGPALGFLSFAIGVTLTPSAFAAVSGRDAALGAALQWIAKPAVALAVVAALAPPAGVAAGVLLVASVSGAQLANYATFLAAPSAAPLSIVLTAAGTAGGALITPILTTLLVGSRAPVDPAAVLASIAQVVVVPIAAGLLLASRAPAAVARARPALAFAALVDTYFCVAASLAQNAGALGGAAAAVPPVVAFHAVCGLAGAALASVARLTPAARRALALQGGMQSSLLALLLATKLFSNDPLVAATAGVSTVVMTLGGFAAAAAWRAVDGGRGKGPSVG